MRLMKKLTLAILLLLILSNLSVPAGAINAAGISDIKSETAVLMDADTGQVLYQKDMDKRMYPASITKIMTGMLALKNGILSDFITMSDEAIKTVDSDSANIALSPGEQLTMEQALYAISIASANDAANGIAEAIGGSIDDFVALMNAAAKEAGAVNTHFDNANGLPDDDHYTTAYDMALITAKALKSPGFTEIFGAKRYKIPPTNKQPETRIVNSSNRFLNGDMIYDGMLISKAGWTVDAQHTLVSAAERNGTTLIAVVMKAADSTVKWSDTVSLLDYGFDQFKRVMISKEEILSTAPDDMDVPEGGYSKLNPDTYEAQDVTVLLPINESPEDIVISFGAPRLDTSSSQAEIPVSISVPSADPMHEPIVLLGTTIKATLQQDAPEADSATAEGDSKISVFMIILLVFASVISMLLLLVALLLIRRAIIVSRRKRRKSQAIAGRRLNK
jgi:D-alanyl-D-alanine carboxypeptidase (penicillin-binding protein 5/6)